MKILSYLFFVCVVPSSRQLTCETNLRRPGKLDFSIANKRGKTETWTLSATDCYSRVDFIAAFLDSLELNLASFTVVIQSSCCADYFNFTLTAVRKSFVWVLKPFLYHNFRRQVHIWLPFWHDMDRFHAKAVEKGLTVTAVSLLKNTLTSQWIVAPPPSAWPSRSVLLCTPATTSPSSSSTTCLTIRTVKEPWTSRSPRRSSGSPSPSTQQMPVAAVLRLIQIMGGVKISKWTGSLW